MVELDFVDFIGTRELENYLSRLFPEVAVRRATKGDGTPVCRMHIHGKDTAPSAHTPDARDPRDGGWRSEVTRSKATQSTQWSGDYGDGDAPTPICAGEPKSIFEMLKDGDEQLEKLLGKIVDERLAKRAAEDGVPVKEKNPFVYIANRLTFLIQTKFPLVFDTSNIETGEMSMTVAVNEGKTVPKLNHIDELGFITSEVNRDEDIQKELGEYLEDTGYGNIYCFPSVIGGGAGEPVYAVKFVLYPNR